VRTPNLVVPATSLAPVPEWADIVLGGNHGGKSLQLSSGGTWFHPAEAGALVVPPVRPGPTHQVQVLLVGDDLAVWHDAGGWASEAQRALAALIDARNQATPARALWAPMLGTPADYALWAYAGVDLFDAGPLLLAATRGEVLTTDGALPIAEAAEVLGVKDSPAAIAKWNLDAARAELARIRHALQKGSLRALVERRIYSRPGAIELLRRLDRQHAYLEAATPTHRAGAMPCHTIESLSMPEVERFRRRLRERYQPPAGADVLVLLPCSAKKPYKTSKTHRYFQRALDASGVRNRCHEVMVTSPLGLVPRELEELYPAANYDVPVTGRWFRDEEDIIKIQLAALLAAGNYRHVIVHADAKTVELVQSVLPSAVATAAGRPSSMEDCDRLRDALRALGQAETGHRKTADMGALASFQFGRDAASALMVDARAHGRSPFTKLAGPSAQLGMTTPERGILSLTLEGAARVAPYAGHRVYIQDFQLKKTSSLFAVGVEGADDAVRPGDEVVVLCDDEVRGVGVAQMSAEEMTHAKRGVAVTLRHTATQQAEVPA
jgi:archaeosine synthase alpha-subunit